MKRNINKFVTLKDLGRLAKELERKGAKPIGIIKVIRESEEIVK